MAKVAIKSEKLSPFGEILTISLPFLRYHLTRGKYGKFLLRCTLFCHSVATFLTSVSSYEGGCGFEDYFTFLWAFQSFSTLPQVPYL